MVDIDAAVSQNPLSLTQCQTACAGGLQSCLLAERSGQVAGFIVYATVIDEVTILALSVRGSCQGAGVGRKLLGAALHLVKDAGAARCLLEVRASNIVAQHLYLSQGFAVDGLRKNYYAGHSGREDAVLMSLCLQE